ncbi:hypothetical protein HU200_037112 [Digitaria exilis]|uniref:Uncharacterized protein n=1 Tax=Digitaria exilis TaxID=1010633 RepID=A0A835EHP4_9POAL|nr:hypothetical protein HU200_037112 [Digitaria exilis]
MGFSTTAACHGFDKGRNEA